MINLCTLSDHHYIIHGLTLYDSLIKHADDFKLHYLCVDEIIFKKLKQLNLPSMEVYFAGDYEELLNISGASLQAYCWELSSRFCKFLFDKFEIPNIMYIDSDITFYEGIKNVYQELKEKSIGILPHLHIGVGSGPGGYNVGIIYFKNDEYGRSCLDFWVHCVLDPHNKKVRKLEDSNKTFKIVDYNSCGDQKFLELFEHLYPLDVHIIGDQTGHGAPWNLHLYDYEKFSMEDKIITFRRMNNRVLPLVFMHFSGFTPDFEKNIYSATKERFNESFISTRICREIYNEYFKFMKETKERYDLTYVAIV